MDRLDRPQEGTGLRGVMGATTGRMSQTTPEQLEQVLRIQYVPKEGQVLLHPESRKAREEFAKYFCKFDFTGQVPKEKEKD